jgi:ABC-2 type transport system permease protein
MPKFLLVLKHEVVTTLGRRSFQYTAFGIPLIAVLIFGITVLLKSNTFRPGVDRLAASEIIDTQELESQSKGYVDFSGLIRSIPESVPPTALQAFPDEAAAVKALEGDKIRLYYLIPENYIKTGEIVIVRPDFNPLSAQTGSNLIQQVLQVNLLGGDIHLANQIKSPLDLQVILLEGAPQPPQDNPLAFFLPFGITLFFYITILMSASLLLSSITKDKQNRMLEVLMVSLTPQQILSGKILGLGVVGLIQTAVWIGTGYVLLRLSGRSIQMPFEYQLQPNFIVWAFVFFVLGYALYASLMASIGALASNLREASQLAFVLLLPMMIPLLTITVFMRYPNGVLATALSLFPLTAPVTMLTRLATVVVPPWQVILSLSLIIMTTYLILRLVARMFRAQVLLSGQPFNIQRLITALVASPKRSSNLSS